MTADSSDGPGARLPAAAVPRSYNLRLTPDLTDFTFDGEVAVDIEIVARTRTITLNAAELDLREVSISRGGEDRIHGTADCQPEAETATLTFPAELAPGEATLHIAYSGIINDRLRGFYRSAYMDAHGRQRHLASTQFEATDARRALPCWDEPSLKATFTVSLVVPEQLTALSNMPEESSVAEGGTKTVRFETTPPMSTYLLAFAVGDFASLEERSGSGTLMRVWTTAGNEDRGRFALEESLRLLDYFNDYFGIPYPLPKLDHVAIPDFAAGAMENWGLITYREPALLVDEQASSSGTRQLVSEIVAHEMAHMWFGDLVTMSWWNDLWLNESFASWMGDRAVDALHPGWSKWNQFLVHETSRAFQLDGLTSTHPIEQQVDDPAEIGQLFDAISYSKGAAVIRMLEAYLGKEPFRDGIRLYLERHRLANATTADLWTALADASGHPVGEIMDSWTGQAGHPFLEARIGRSGGQATVSLAQRRFTYESVTGEEQADGQLWRIPASVASQDGTQVTELMAGQAAVVTVPDGGGQHLKVNPGQNGFYRVRYEPEELSRLAAAASDGRLSAADRLGLVDDAFALCLAGMLPAGEFLELAGRYRHETEQPVWATVADALGGLDLLIEGEAGHRAYRSWARDLLGPICRKVGWEAAEGEGHLTSLLRTNVLGLMGAFGDSATLAEARGRFGLYLKRPDDVPADLRRVVFALSARLGDERTYGTMWDLHAGESLQEEKVRLLYALTQFPQPELIAETLDRSFGDRVRAHEAVGVIVRSAGTATGRDLAWQFVKDNWREVDRRYGEGGFALMAIVEITAGFTTEERHSDVREFFADNPAPAAERTIRQCLEKIRQNAAWLGRNRAGLSDWLAG